MANNQDIDAVIIWVDGSDPEWQLKRRNFLSEANMDNRVERYRDMGLLRYLFRGLEAFAPWIRTIHFVTCGQKPAWLNCDAPKLHFILHEEYVPGKYLPTFNSNTIELNFHRIDSLSERFIYFNDDQFLISNTTPDDFFHRGLPKQSASFLPNFFDPTDTVFSGILSNSLRILYRNFSREDFLKYFYKHMSPRNGGIKNSLRNAKNIVMGIQGIEYSHLPSPLLKSCISNVWDAEYAVLDATCKNKFRSSEDVNQYLIQFWQIALGNYFPNKENERGQYFYLPNSYSTAAECIKCQKMKAICLNDGKFSSEDEYQKCVAAITQAFDTILPYKSSFEL